MSALLDVQHLTVTFDAAHGTRVVDDVSFTMAVGYEQRTSNVAGKAYDNFTAGASLDFSYNFERLR